MASEWRRTSVGEVCSSIVDCVNKTAPVVNHETPYRMIRTTNIKNGRLDMSNTKYVHEGTFRHWTRRAVPQTGDVLLTREAPLGEVAIIRDEQNVFLGQRLMQYRADRTKLDPRFLFYSFLGAGLQSQIRAHGGSGSTVDHIRVPDCMRFELSLPPLPEQRAIAHILGTLDDKIELNRRMSGTLEAMARALFKSWFVDFDPVRAKSEGRDPGLLKHLADLFPDSFEESELGEIPEGWRVGSVYEIASVIYGAPFASAKFNSDRMGSPLIRIRDLADEAPGVWTPELHPKGYKVQSGDIVVGMDGAFRAYLWGGTEGWLNQRICVFVPKSGWSAAFVRNAIAGPLAHVEATETATTVIHLGKADIDRFKVILPHENLALTFNKTCQPWYDHIVVCKQESRALALLRDTLLPKLISGELRVKDAERFVERTAA
jgi:type I restriction enzyme S subunit